ncbi:hypothetical protein ACPPVS_03825 [Cellulomonas sp. McL0617]|uniref:hypothetical protein n=1 Tax=Cellulomonas sp. McL0617 TaxID=3415675 RepID=UPI003CF67018
MHPDLYYVLHQERERELAAELRHRHATHERPAPAPRPVRRLWPTLAEVMPGMPRRTRRARYAPPVVCCATA